VLSSQGILFKGYFTAGEKQQPGDGKGVETRSRWPLGVKSGPYSFGSKTGERAFAKAGEVEGAGLVDDVLTGFEQASRGAMLMRQRRKEGQAGVVSGRTTTIGVPLFSCPQGGCRQRLAPRLVQVVIVIAFKSQ
jgi:hypothetical protein